MIVGESTPTRRAFLKTIAAASAATAASSRRVLGANDRVRVGFIGMGLIGKRHLLDFQAEPDCEIAGISEVSDERMDEGVAAAGNNPARFPDFRKMLERPDIDAVVVSTPDHWHALMTILACAAGKDVYVEKPLTHALREGEWMLDAARARKRVVQVGTQQRSGRHYQRALALLRDGHIGDVRGARIGAFRNILPGFTKPVGRPLSAAQWDLWLGPAPKVAFDPARCLYHFRWFNAYSGGQTTNLLAHEIDIVQWVTGDVPRRVAAFAQRKSLTGFGETPDVFDAIFEYPDFLASWSSREIAAGGKAGLEIYGTKGTLSINRRGFEVAPDRALTPESQIPRFTQPACRHGGADVSHRGGQRRRIRTGARSIPAARPQLSRQRQEPGAAGLGSRISASDRHRLPPRQHRRPTRPRRELGRRPKLADRRSRSQRHADKNVPCALGSRARRGGEGFTRMTTRREFLGVVMAAPLGLRGRGNRTGMCLAYTSFAVRMLQGRDILKSTAAALPAEALLDLCDRFGSGGAQVDWSQLTSTDPPTLAGLRKRVAEGGLTVELSVPSRYLESPEAYQEMAGVATALGVDRIRVALLYGRRYETFKTREDWTTWATKWRTTLVGMRKTFNAHPIRVGIENHKDWHASELAELLNLIDSPRVGACVDFGNNISLLESPLETVRTLAPFAVTTHLKDMAVKPTADGFGLSEVPLGDGFLPLAEIIGVLRAARPDVPLCLEMITRDPLPVPYKTDRYWVAIDRPAPEALARFEHDVLGKAWTRELPTITGLSPEAQIAAEDENVRRSVEYARTTLKL